MLRFPLAVASLLALAGGSASAMTLTSADIAPGAPIAAAQIVPNTSKVRFERMIDAPW